MQLQLESMLKESGITSAPSRATGPASASQGEGNQDSSKIKAPSAPVVDDFQKTIRKTMERMQNSGEQATAAAAADDSDDNLAELMKQMQAGAGVEDEEVFSKMLLGMMEQLTNKEILYEPMKELDDKFPEWIEKNKTTTPKEDMTRYEEQRKVVKEIVMKFEEKAYADSNLADREYIVERMQKVCVYVGGDWLVLTRHRCKQLVRHHLILLEIWQQRRKHLEHRKRAAHNNRIQYRYISVSRSVISIPRIVSLMTRTQRRILSTKTSKWTMPGSIRIRDANQ